MRTDAPTRGAAGARPTTVGVRFSRAEHGDFRPAEVGDADDADASSALRARRRALFDGPWAWTQQVHGAAVRTVAGHGEPTTGNGAPADALVSATAGVALSVITADCAPVLLWSSSGSVIGAAHAGWRGLQAGVLAGTVRAMRRLGGDAGTEGRVARRGLPAVHGDGDNRVGAVLGPCIHACCYEFGTELDALADRFGPGVRGRTSWGSPALDLPAAVAAALAEESVSVDLSETRCTACDSGYFSYRARADARRQVALVWREA